MSIEKALYQIYSSFGLTAYEENSVPVEAQMPYITYEVATDNIDSENNIALVADLWYKSDSWSGINAKADEISKALTGGIKKATDDGFIILYRSSPFSQNMTDDSDQSIKRKHLNVECMFITP